MLFKNVASQGVYIFAKDTVAKTGKTGDAANITCNISKDGAASAETNTTATGSVTEIGGGFYWCPLTQAETNADMLCIFSSSVTANIVIDPIAASTTAGAIPKAAHGGAGGLGTVDANNRIVGVQGTLNTLDDLGVPPTAAAIADAHFDELLAGHAIVGSAGERLARIPNAVAGGAGGIPTADANNRVAGIAGTVVNTLDVIAGAAFVEGTHALDQTVSLSGLADGLYQDTRYPKYAALIEADFSGSDDEYTVKFLLNGEPIEAGITVPTITVVRRSDGVTLVSAESLTAISAGWYKYTEASTRVTIGDTALIDVAATYAGGTIKGQRSIPKYA